MTLTLKNVWARTTLVVHQCEATLLHESLYSESCKSLSAITSCQFPHMHLLLNTGIPVTRAWFAWPVTTIGGVIPVSTVFYEISRERCSPRKDTGGPRTHYDLSPVFDRAQLLIASPHTIAHRHGMAIKIVASQIYLYPILPFHTRSSLLDITLVSKK